MQISCSHDGTIHPEAANYCMRCGHPLRPDVLPATPPQPRSDCREFSLPPTVTVTWRSMTVSRLRETVPVNHHRLVTGVQLALLGRSTEDKAPGQVTAHPFATNVDLARIDVLPEPAVRSVGWLDARFDQSMTSPLDWTATLNLGLASSVVLDAAAVMAAGQTVMRRVLSAIGCGLVGFVVFEAAGGADAPVWVAATCLAYLGVTGVAGRLDQRYSQGPPGPPPPETYT
jgi:hypothetical protein